MKHTLLISLGLGWCLNLYCQAESVNISFTVFKDNIGSKGESETRRTFKTSAAYRNYFGHGVPPAVNFASEWVMFYSAGIKMTTGYIASTKKITLNQVNNTLNIATSLATPDSTCRVSHQKFKPFVLIKFRRPFPNPTHLNYYHDNTDVHCKNLDLSEGSDNVIDKNKSTSNANATDKWVITPVATMKGILGALDINFPAGVDRDIWIYQPADNKYVASVSKNAKSFPIAPGEYRFTISEVAIENVPIKKGHVTRLKSGFINIVSEGVWHINDETKEKQHTSGNKPRKVALPVGSYQLNLGGQFYPVIIKDGETVEY